MTDKTQLKRKKATARKQKQREKLTQLGVKRVEVTLSDAEYNHLLSACEQRALTSLNPDQPYSVDEYITRLIRNDVKRLAEQLENASCTRCKAALPRGCGAVFRGERACWLTDNPLAL
jgi:hypothetical protein